MVLTCYNLCVDIKIQLQSVSQFYIMKIEKNGSMNAIQTYLFYMNNEVSYEISYTFGL